MEWRSPEADDGLMQALREVLARQAEVEGIAVVGIDGLPIASISPPGIKGKRLMAAALVALASLGPQRPVFTGPNQVNNQVHIIRAEFGYVLVRPFSKASWLAVLCGPQANLGSIFSDWLGPGGVPRDPRSPAPEPIIPRTPPSRLAAQAKPDYDAEE